jgi:hypothetical protein
MTSKPLSSDEYFYLCALLDSDLNGNEQYTSEEWGWRHRLKGKLRALSPLSQAKERDENFCGCGRTYEKPEEARRRWCSDCQERGRLIL